MRQLTRKLHSQRGASILLALLFFLICGFVGAVVLGSAVTNAEKLQGRREDQQTYYAVSSAARLVQTALDGVGCQGVEHKTIYQCAGGQTQGLNWSPSLHSDTFATPVLTLTAGDGTLANSLRQAAEAVFQSKTTYTTPTRFNGWSRDFTIAAQDLPEVQVHMTMDEQYTAVFTLQTQSGGYAMTLTCPTETVRPEEHTAIGDCTHTLTEVDPLTGKTTHSTHTFGITDYTRLTAIRWPAGSITKGVSDGAA